MIKRLLFVAVALLILSVPSFTVEAGHKLVGGVPVYCECGCPDCICDPGETEQADPRCD